MKKPSPYIGITGISRPEELAQLAYTTGDIVLPAGYMLQAGILLSSTVFAGEESRITRFPAKDMAYQLLADVPDDWTPIIHYSGEADIPLSEQLDRIFSHECVYELEVCRAVQLNLRNPDPAELRKVRARFADLVIVQQVPMWREDLQTAEGLVRFVEPCQESVSHFLFDPSGGRGKPLSEEKLNLIAAAIPHLPAHVGVVLAGGISPENVGEFCARVTQVVGPGFSIDAEGRLRGGKCDGRRVGDQMNPEKVRSYIEGAVRALVGTA